MSSCQIHPAVDGGLKPAAKNSPAGRFIANCSQNKVEISIKGSPRTITCALHQVLEAKGRCSRRSPS